MGNIGPNFRPPPPPGGKPALPNATPTPSLPPQGGTVPVGGTNAGVVFGGGCPTSLTALFAAPNVLLNPAQMTQLLRNLLQMPKEMVQLLALLANVEQTATPELLKQLLTDNPAIPLDELQELLVKRLDQGQEKLLKLLQSSPLPFSESASELGELLKTVSHLMNTTGHSPVEALKTAVTLYLPYYPLNGPQQFSLSFEPAGEEEAEGGSEGNPLVIYLETLSLGVFRIALSIVRQTCLYAVIEHDAPATPMLPEFARQLTEAVLADGLPAPDLSFQIRDVSPLRAGVSEATRVSPLFDASSIRTAVEALDDRLSEKRAVALHPVGGVSALAIHLAYLVIRLLLALDDRQRLHDVRASQSPPH